jgi:MYXO-CTERM domain-containing protein
LSGLSNGGFGPGTVIDVIDVSQVAASPTPEPSTWSLAILGVGLLGAGLRHGRRRSAAAAI